MEVAGETAIGIAITAGMAAALWGAFLGVRSATAGGIWTLRHLKRVVPASLGLALFGILLAIAVRPFFLGLAVAYVAGVVAFFGRIVRRSVQTAMNLDGARAEPLPAERQAPILRKAGQGLLVAGGALVVLGIVDLGWRGWPAMLDFAFAAVLLVPGFVYLRRAGVLSEV